VGITRIAFDSELLQGDESQDDVIFYFLFAI